MTPQSVEPAGSASLRLGLSVLLTCLAASVSLCVSGCVGEDVFPVGGSPAASENLPHLRESSASNSGSGVPTTPSPGSAPDASPYFGDTQGLARRFQTVEGGSEFVQTNGELITVRPRDTIPAILSPMMAPVSEATGWMEADELILGVEIGGDARAYPIRILSRHEVVNDVVGTTPIAITW